MVQIKQCWKKTWDQHLPTFYSVRSTLTFYILPSISTRWHHTWLHCHCLLGGVFSAVTLANSELIILYSCKSHVQITTAMTDRNVIINVQINISGIIKISCPGRRYMVIQTVACKKDCGEHCSQHKKRTRECKPGLALSTVARNTIQQRSNNPSNGATECEATNTTTMQCCHLSLTPYMVYVVALSDMWEKPCHSLAIGLSVFYTLCPLAVKRGQDVYKSQQWQTTSRVGFNCNCVICH